MVDRRRQMVDIRTGADFSELLSGAYKPQPPHAMPAAGMGAAAAQALPHKSIESKSLALAEPGPQELKVGGGVLSGLEAFIMVQSVITRCNIKWVDSTNVLGHRLLRMPTYGEEEDTYTYIVT
jgi:hypothetical protein